MRHGPRVGQTQASYFQMMETRQLGRSATLTPERHWLITLLRWPGIQFPLLQDYFLVQTWFAEALSFTFNRRRTRHCHCNVGASIFSLHHLQCSLQWESFQISAPTCSIFARWTFDLRLGGTVETMAAIWPFLRVSFDFDFTQKIYLLPFKLLTFPYPRRQMLCSVNLSN